MLVEFRMLSSFLFELVGIRGSRQSYFDNVAFTKVELTDIINHISTVADSYCRVSETTRSKISVSDFDS